MAEITYPSIAGPAFAHLGSPCVAFEKYDGSNLRFFWDQKRGWHSSGTRYRWFKAATPTFGAAIELFQLQYAKGISDTLRRFIEYRGVTELVAFCEFFGASTFSGLHKDGEPKHLLLFRCVSARERLCLPARLRCSFRPHAARTGRLRRPV